jgi:hypothetical protein
MLYHVAELHVLINSASCEGCRLIKNAFGTWYRTLEEVEMRITRTRGVWGVVRGWGEGKGFSLYTIQAYRGEQRYSSALALTLALLGGGCLTVLPDRLTLSRPAGQIFPTYKESFQVRCDKSIPPFLHAAIYFEVSLFRWARVMGWTIGYSNPARGKRDFSSEKPPN